MCSLRLFNGFFQHFPLDYCLQSICLDFVIEPLLEIVSVSLLQHAQITFQHVDSLCEVDGAKRFRERSEGLPSGGIIGERVLFGVADD